MKTAPVTYTEIAVIGGVLVVGALAWRVYSKLPKSPAEVLALSAAAVDQRGTGSALGASQGWVDGTVRRGQEAGASTFVTSFFTGLSVGDERGTGSALGTSQGWVDDTVRRGQEAGASTFVTSFFTGLFK